MSELSPAAQAVLDALCMEELNGPQQIMARAHAAAALRATADEVISSVPPPCEDYDEYAQGFLAAHIKHRKQILAIAEELEAQ